MTTLVRVASWLCSLAILAAPLALQAQPKPTATPAPAPTPAPNPAPKSASTAAPLDHFAAADKNSDGFVDLTEFHVDILRGWHRLDLDGDGHITEAEVMGIPDASITGALWQRMLKSADANRDGSLSFTEVVYARMDFFAVADSNKDEKLSRAEVQSFDQRAAAAMPKK